MKPGPAPPRVVYSKGSLSQVPTSPYIMHGSEGMDTTVRALEKKYRSMFKIQACFEINYLSYWLLTLRISPLTDELKTPTIIVYSLWTPQTTNITFSANSLEPISTPRGYSTCASPSSAWQVARGWHWRCR
jgi:hypothetical protein